MQNSESLFSLKLSDSTRTWLEYATNVEAFDPRVAKAKFFEQLPRDFNPRGIDHRLYNNDAPTIFAYRIFRDNYAPIVNAEKVALAVQSIILDKPGVENIAASDIASKANLQIADVVSAMSILQELTSFASGWQNAYGSTIGQAAYTFQGPSGYDAVLAFKTIDKLLADVFELRAPTEWEAIFGKEHDSDVISSVESAQESLVIAKPMTAFIIMPIDPAKPELEDVLETIKTTCAKFKIKAYRADEIEHQDKITNIILDEIRDCEFLIADLTHERPNVYYEIGFSHAMNKKPILYRRAGTKLHFDLAVHNVPEYRNITELRDLLTRRLEAILGRSAG